VAQIKVSIYEDNDSLRETILQLLNSDKDILCVGSFADATAIVEQTRELKPDLILIDHDMPEVNGAEGIRLVKADFPEVRLLMQTIFEDDEKIYNALRNGADGYILKNTLYNKLLDSIHDVMDGGLVMSPSIARQALRLSEQKQAPAREEFALNEREHQILHLLIKGYSYKMIAAETSVSYATVNYHIKSIYRKMKVNSGLEAVSKAIDNKLF
jgi:DNA-binding NarL/FixJ family response regulator